MLAFIFLAYSTVFSADGYGKTYQMFDRPVNWCRALKHLGEDSTYERVALVAFPGSGSVWLRSLLQQATGIFTGSDTYEHHLKDAGILVNEVNDVLVVKVDVPRPYHFDRKLENYTKVILLVRNPKDSIQSYYNTLHAGNLGLAERTRFQGSNWKDFVDDQMNNWAQFYTSCLTWNGGPIYIVVYELLVRETIKVMQGIMEFIEYEFSTADMDCVREFTPDSPFRRKIRRGFFNPYSTKQEYLLNHYAMEMLHELQKYQETHDISGWV